jgi:secreted PhoX family phosphatase
MGDDGQDQYFYKYVSAAPYRANVPRGERRKLLEHGTLYVADFIQRRWIPLDLERTPELKQGFSSQAEVLIHTRKAGTLVKATQLDRPEDCEVHPRDGSVYIAMTNNDRRLNFFGRIVRLLEKADRADGEAFTFEIFLTGGPDSGLAAPDNLAFDRQANLWVACDLHETKLNKPGFDVFGNNGLFVVPTLGKERGCAFQFAAAPVEAEFTGPWFTEKGDTLFLSVQHPGSLTEKIAEPTSTWPRLKNDGIPRPSVIAIRGTFG